MGDLLSTPSENPSETHQTTAMSSSEIPQSKPEKSTNDSKTLESQTPREPTSDPPSMEQKETLEGQEQINVKEGDQEGEEEEEEEEGECGFCLFMKGGGCRESFTAWEKCIEEAEKNEEDIVDKCFEVTGALKKCMEAHPDYYGPILQAEKAAEAEAVRELEKEKVAAAASDVNSAEGSEEQVSDKEAAAASSSSMNSSEVNSAEGSEKKVSEES